MKKNLARALVATTLLGTLCAVPALAQETQGNWLVRARAVRLDPANKSDAIGALAVPEDAITINNKTIPEVDITYFFTPNIAAELVLTVPQKQRVTIEQSALGGPVDIGTFKHLPPTLTLQYHFLPEGTFRPGLCAVNVETAFPKPISFATPRASPRAVVAELVDAQR